MPPNAMKVRSHSAGLKSVVLRAFPHHRRSGRSDHRMSIRTINRGGLYDAIAIRGIATICSHPAKEAKRYQVRDARDYLMKLGVTP